MSRANSPLADRMLFLVGSQRSGTHWLQRILSTHPDVASIPSETQLFTHAISRVAEVVHHGVLSSPSTAGIYMDPDAFCDATRDYCDAIFGGLVTRLHGDARRFILERSPNHVFHLDLIARIYPDARVVHIIRDGRDVARSQLAQTYGATTIQEAAREWRRAIETARAAAPSFRDYVEVRYEQLLAAPNDVVRGLFEQLRLPYQQALVDAALTEAAIPANVDTSDARVGRGKWQESWTRADVDAFLTEVGPLAAEFGMDGDASGRRHRFSGRRRRRRRPDVTGSVAGGVPAPERIRRATRAVDIFLSALATADEQALIRGSAADLEARVVHGSDDRRATGPAATTLLLTAVQGDSVAWTHQVRGYVHGGVPTFTVVLTYQSGDGKLADRVLVLRPRGDVIDAVTYYRLPLGPVQRDEKGTCDG